MKIAPFWLNLYLYNDLVMWCGPSYLPVGALHIPVSSWAKAARLKSSRFGLIHIYIIVCQYGTIPQHCVFSWAKTARLKSSRFGF